MQEGTASEQKADVLGSRVCLEALAASVSRPDAQADPFLQTRYFGMFQSAVPHSRDEYDAEHPIAPDDCFLYPLRHSNSALNQTQ